MNKNKKSNLMKLINKTQHSMVKVSEVRLNIKQIKRKNFAKDIDSLIKSIQAYGLLQPIGVSRLSNLKDDKHYKWEIIWGRRRLFAFELLGLEDIPAIIFDDTLTKKEIEIVSLAESPQTKLPGTNDED